MLQTLNGQEGRSAIKQDGCCESKTCKLIHIIRKQLSNF